MYEKVDLRALTSSAQWLYTDLY